MEAMRETSLKYVYILTSVNDPERHYTGITANVEERLAKHNSGAVKHTCKFRPWRLNSYVAFSDEKRAVAFERYLKSGSGRAFAKKTSLRLCASFGLASQPVQQHRFSYYTQ